MSNGTARMSISFARGSASLIVRPCKLGYQVNIATFRRMNNELHQPGILQLAQCFFCEHLVLS
jgi:hypothetical protein